MADISPVGVQDFGNLLTSFGQGIASQNATNASAANTNAQTGLVGQQTQGAALDNQQKALALQMQQAQQALKLKAIKDAINGYAPQPDETAGSDQSASNGAGLSMGMQATPGNSGTPVPKNVDKPQAGSVVPSQPEEEPTPDNWYNKSQIVNGNRQGLYVDPAGTPQEKQAIQTAILSGDPSLKEAAIQARDNGVKSRLAASQSKASGMYDTITKGVLDAPEGRKMDALDAISPGIAAKIRKMIPDKVEEEEAAESYARFVANDMHQYTGRKVEKGDDGYYRDADTGRVMTERPRVGMSEAQIADTVTKLLTPSIKVTDSRGQESLVSPAQQMFPGANPKTAILKYLDSIGVHGASPTVTGAPRAELQSQVDNAISGTKDTLRQQRDNPTPPPVSGDASTFLPDATGRPIDIRKLPAPSFPPVRGNSSPGPEDTAAYDRYKQNADEVNKDAEQKLVNANQTEPLIKLFEQKLNTINPNDVGPRGDAYKTYLTWKAKVLGSPDKDLVDMGELSKFATQLGIKNADALLGHQDITNDKMHNILNYASASPTQPLDVMKMIVSYQKANNEFDKRWANTARAALNASRDPGAVQALENGRDAFVQQSMKRDGYEPPQPKPMPDQATLKAYADKGFKGDIEAAKAHLRKNGYQ